VGQLAAAVYSALNVMKRLHRARRRATARSVREIANELAIMGYKNKNGAQYSPSCVSSMVKGGFPASRS
jgi:hypothetical protein